MDDALSIASSRGDDLASSPAAAAATDPLQTSVGGGAVMGSAATGGWLESERRYMKHRLETGSKDRDKNYLCTVCSALCESSADLQRHLSKHVSDLKVPTGNRVCPICSLEFVSRFALNVHLNSPRHKEREMRIRSLFHCDHCGHYFANRDAYAMHMLDVTREAAAATSQQNGGQNQKPCLSGLILGEVDTLSFLHSLANKSSPSLPASAESSPSAEPVKVKDEPRDDGYGDVKNGVTSSTEDVAENNNGYDPPHRKMAREVPLDLRAVKEEFRDQIRLSPVDGHLCRVCSQLFDSRDALAMHMMEHCKEDTSSFPTDGASSLVNSSYTCYVCGRECADLDTLGMHVLVHSREQPASPTSRDRSQSRDGSCDQGKVDMSKSVVNGDTVSYLGLNGTELATDIIRQDSLTSFTCKLCDIEFSSLIAVTRHCTCVSHILKVERLLRQSFVGAEELKCTDCSKSFERDCDFRIHKSLLCPNLARSPLQSPIGQSSTCSEPTNQKRSLDMTQPMGNKRVRSAGNIELPVPTSWTGAGLIAHAPSLLDNKESDGDSRAEETERGAAGRPGSIRPASNAPSASPDHDLATNRQQILAHLHNQADLLMCTYCKIVYTDKTMYYLHMGLHNHNNPWQCNLCGKACTNAHEFSSHVIHY